MRSRFSGEVIIERASADSAESRQLVAELWAEIDELYGNGEPTDPASLAASADDIAFIIARGNHAAAVGCGALRRRSAEVAEVKRVYVQQTARRSGVARAIMHELEQLARAAGFTEIWLETGLRQPDAMRLYESLGYTRRAAFGDYKDDPESVSYGKTLS